MSSLQALGRGQIPPHAAAAILPEGGLASREQLWARASGIARAISGRPGERWLLAAEDAWNCLTGLLGLWWAGKQVVLPPGFQPAAMAETAAHCDGLLDDAGIPGFPAAPGGALPRELPASAGIELTTSGSSGQARAVRKTLGQLDAEVQVLEAQWGGRIGPGPVFATVPHLHIYGLLFRLLWPLAAGRPFDSRLAATPHELLDRLRAHGPGAVVSSPAHLSRLSGLLDIGELAPHVTAIFSSSAPLPAQVAAEFGAAMGQAPVEIYGSTETGGIAWRTQWPEADPSWMPLPGVQVDFDAEGRLQVRSPFAGRAARVAVGDLGELQPDGRFRLRGRADRIVKLEGKRVALAAIEQHLLDHELVRECAIILVPGRRETLGAIVALTQEGEGVLAARGKQALVGELRRHLLRHHEPVTLPRRWRFRGGMPYDARGKLPLDALLALFSEAGHDAAR